MFFLFVQLTLVTQFSYSKNNRWLALSPRKLPSVIKTKHSVKTKVFGVVTSDTYIMSLFIFPHGLKLLTETFIKCLEEIVWPGLKRWLLKDPTSGKRNMHYAVQARDDNSKRVVVNKLLCLRTKTKFCVLVTFSTARLQQYIWCVTMQHPIWYRYGTNVYLVPWWYKVHLHYHCSQVHSDSEW